MVQQKAFKNVVWSRMMDSLTRLALHICCSGASTEPLSPTEEQRPATGSMREFSTKSIRCASALGCAKVQRITMEVARI
jgi:hypothetical protein